jgi:hypothetical protein
MFGEDFRILKAGAVRKWLRFLWGFVYLLEKRGVGSGTESSSSLAISKDSSSYMYVHTTHAETVIA